MLGNDPRVFFAAERTLLAWVRTGLGLVGMGFVVAKFGLFFRLLHPDTAHTDHSWALPIGVVLALFGALATAIAAWQHQRFCRTLLDQERPPNYRPEPAFALGYGVAIVGLLLAAVLVI
jgi:putative membrane protein